MVRLKGSEQHLQKGERNVGSTWVPVWPGSDREAHCDGQARLPAGSVHRILRNSTLNLVGQGVLAVAHLAVLFVLARALGTAGLGQYYTLFALIQVGQLILEAGLTTILTCRIVQQPHSWRAIAAEGTALFALLSIASVTVFMGVGCAWAWGSGDWSVIPLAISAGIACGALQAQRFSTALFRAFENFGCENVNRILQGALFLVLVVALNLHSVANVSSVLGMFALSHVVAAAVLLVELQRRWHCLGWRFNRSVVRSWMAAAIPLGLGDVVRRLTWQLDTVLLGFLKPPALVGIYSVAYRPLGPLNWLPQAVLTAMFPALARLADEDRRSLARAFAHSVRLLWIVSLPLAVVICLTAERLIPLLAGPEFLSAALPMRLLIWVAILTSLSMQFRFLFTAIGQQQMLVRLIIVVFLVEAALELALIPTWGLLGACVGTMCGELLFVLGGLALCRRLGLAVMEWRPLLHSCLAGAVMAVPVWLARGFSLPLLVLAVCAATALYIALVVWWRALHWAEIMRLLHAITGRRASSKLEANDLPRAMVPLRNHQPQVP
jgi:O-antigen/teichoic acid export membrane protein